MFCDRSQNATKIKDFSTLHPNLGKGEVYHILTSPLVPIGIKHLLINTVLTLSYLLAFT